MTMANIHKGMISDVHMLVVVNSCLIGPKDHSKGGKSCLIIKNLAILLGLVRTQTLQKINYLCVFLNFITNGCFEFPCFFSKGHFLSWVCLLPVRCPMLVFPILLLLLFVSLHTLGLSFKKLINCL